MLSNIQNVIADQWEITGASRNQLIEKQGNKIISEVNISTSGQYILYKFEQNGVLKMPYLKANRNVKKICDYVLFTIKKNCLFVLTFELKNGSGCPIEQLKATECLSKYFIETATRVSKTGFQDIQYRRIGITNKSVKMNLKPGKIYNSNNYVQLTSKSKIDIKILCE
jgi:hypothetical protein